MALTANYVFANASASIINVNGYAATSGGGSLSTSTDSFYTGDASYLLSTLDYALAGSVRSAYVHSVAFSGSEQSAAGNFAGAAGVLDSVNFSLFFRWDDATKTGYEIRISGQFSGSAWVGRWFKWVNNVPTAIGTAQAITGDTTYKTLSASVSGSSTVTLTATYPSTPAITATDTTATITTAGKPRLGARDVTYKTVTFNTLDTGGSIVTDSGTFVVTVPNTNLSFGRKLIADSQPFAISGQAVNLIRSGYKLTADVVTYAFGDALVFADYAVNAAAINMLLAVFDTVNSTVSTMTAEQANYIITNNPARLVWSGAPVNLGKQFKLSIGSRIGL